MTLSTRPFGRTGRDVTAIGFGAWAIGGSWGDVSEADAKATLHAALDCWRDLSRHGGCLWRRPVGTPDPRRSGRTRRPAPLRRHQGGPPPAARMWPRATPWPISKPSSTAAATNLGMDTLDLVQLHCPPTAVYYSRGSSTRSTT